jgi:hypothetical protein
MGAGGKVVLGAGASYSEKLLLDEWYPFNRPGSYTVEATLAEVLPQQPEKPLNVWSSQQMTLLVEPRNPARLAAVCRKLLDTALISQDYGTSYAAGFALSYVRDPVALPYLGKLLASGKTLVAAPALTGLVSLGTPEAVRILKSNLATADPSLR